MATLPRTETMDELALSQGSFHRGGRIGKYEILTQLSVGGMAELFLAFTTGPGGFKKYVVVKRILPDIRAQEHFVKMFLDEARITAALNHPHIAQVFELGEDDGLYIAMEFVAGQNLNQVTRACIKRQIPLPLGFSAGMGRDLCLALHYAHTFTDPTGKSLPVIHRDVAQKNVMVTYEGVVKLLDFGIAKAKGSLGRTSAGMVKGTTGYMSPEQVRAEPLDGRSDVFSVGVMLHELLTGRRLFSAETELEEMKLILDAPIPTPTSLQPSVPLALSQVVMKALARNLNDRYATAKEMARALEKACGPQLFDTDRTSAFMRELFSEKLAATRALFESAGTPNGAEVVTSARAAIREDDGADYSGWAVPAAAAQAASDARVAALAKVPKKQRDWRGGAVLASVAVLGLMLCLWFLGSFGRGTPPAVGPSPVILPGATALQEESTAGEQDSPGESTDDSQEAHRTDGEAAKKSAPRGTLTLVTMPPAKVFLNGKELGTTPLFKFELPARTHRLKLVGPDGRARRLSAPVRRGKNTALKLSLNDIPEG